MAKHYRPLVSILLTTLIVFGSQAVISHSAFADGPDPSFDYRTDVSSSVSNTTASNAKNSSSVSVPKGANVDLAAAASPSTLEPTGNSSANAQAASAFANLEPLEAVYSIKSPRGTARATVELSQNADGSWTQEQDVSLLFFRLTDEAHFKVRNHQVIPQRYEQRRNIGSKRNQNVVFDWNAMVVKDIKQNWQTPLKLGLLDQFTMLLQLQIDLLNNNLGKQKTYQVVAKKGRIKSYTVKNEGEETIDTPLGRMQTLRLSQLRAGSDRQTTLWLAPAHNYLMVKTQRIEDDEESELTLVSATLDGVAL